MNESHRLETIRLNAEFVLSAPDLRHCPPPAGPEIAVSGRSNAGKSSVINRLTGNRHTAKVSKTPGRTQLLNFFQLPNGDRLVDLPGYGYAKAEKAAQAVWQSSVNAYLEQREVLCGVVVVMDIRHPLQPFDIDLLKWGTRAGMPLHLLLNKADKLGNGARATTLRAVQKATESYSPVTVQLFSAQTGLGLPELVDRLSTLWRKNALESGLAAELSDPPPP